MLAEKGVVYRSKRGDKVYLCLGERLVENAILEACLTDISKTGKSVDKMTIGTGEVKLASKLLKNTDGVYLELAYDDFSLLRKGTFNLRHFFLNLSYCPAFLADIDTKKRVVTKLPRLVQGSKYAKLEIEDRFVLDEVIELGYYIQNSFSLLRVVIEGE